jgi:nitrite reductase (NADH) small subunit/3-phenylpropionate/trans-cinnamate dioxygenase ferredoxin subunit
MLVRQRVGPLASIPEDEGLSLEIEGRAVALFRRGDRVFAVGGTCPHMGASLADGYVDETTVVCPWHGWAFDLETGTSAFDEEARIPVFRVEVENGDVFVEIDTAARDQCSSAADSDLGSP